MTLQEIATILSIIGTIGGFIYFIVSKILKVIEKRLEVTKAKAESETLLAVKINQSLETNEEIKQLIKSFQDEKKVSDDDLKELKFKQKEQEKDIEKNTNDIKELRIFVDKGLKDVLDRCDRIHKAV
jgi:hypothetical protein